MKWRAGDTIGIAANLDRGRIMVGHNGRLWFRVTVRVTVRGADLDRGMIIVGHNCNPKPKP